MIDFTTDENWWQKVTSPKLHQAITLMVLNHLRELNLNLDHAQAMATLGKLKGMVELIDLKKYQQRVETELTQEEELLNRLNDEY